MPNPSHDISGGANVTGREGETRAAQFLADRGYRILARNVHAAYGEIDLIAQDGDTLVFVEVKARSSRLPRKAAGADAPLPFDLATASVDRRKRERLSRAALGYLAQHQIDAPCRFDVVAIEAGRDGVQIALFQDAFELQDTTPF